jgi:hypothetical protein
MRPTYEKAHKYHDRFRGVLLALIVRAAEATVVRASSVSSRTFDPDQAVASRGSGR